MNPIVSSIIDLHRYVNFMDSLEGVEFNPKSASLYYLIKRTFNCTDSSKKRRMILDVINFKHTCGSKELIETADKLKFVIQTIIPDQRG